MAYTEKPYDFLPPGGQFHHPIQQSPYITSTMFTPDRMVMFYSTDGDLTTITKPHEGYVGPLWIKAVTDFKLTTAGNLYATLATTCYAPYVYGFIYDETLNKWYAIGAAGPAVS